MYYPIFNWLISHSQEAVCWNKILSIPTAIAFTILWKTIPSLTPKHKIEWFLLFIYSKISCKKAVYEEMETLTT